MSKRPLSPLPPVTAVTDYKCLDFEAWKAQQATLASDDNADSGCVYHPSTEDLPDHIWYSLDDQLLNQKLVQMCNDLGRPVFNCNVDDPEITDLVRALGRAKKTPRAKTVNIAVVGNQGVGKSSTINALLNRDLVDASASSSACTAFATIIEHKAGAADDTDRSDLKVTFLDLYEIRDFVEEQIKRYADVYIADEDDNDAEMEHVTEDESVDEDADEPVFDADVSDSDFSDASESPVANKKKHKKVSKTLQAGADTAEQFFRIIFNAHRDQAKEAELQEWLNRPDLEDGSFLEHCVKVASQHLAQIQAEEQGNVEYKDVKDTQLQDVRDHATNMWALVKAVTILTGSVLLRNGIRFMDLPGYGDLNQTRSAVVNEYRRKANFEMIVAKSDRYLTKTDEDRFLHRAIRHHEAKNVFLVLNKADSCLETPQSQVVRMLRTEVEEPFTTISRYLPSARASKGEDKDDVQRYRRYLIKEAQMAAGRRECDRICHKMQKKGVQVFSVSSARYLDWLDPDIEDHPLDVEGTGIPALRRSLLMLPAEANYENLRYHVRETVADVEDKVSRLLMKFNNDVDVANMHRHLLNYLPTLGTNLRSLALTAPHDLITEAWTDATKSEIAKGMEKLLKSYPEGDIAYHTFWLLLRNNGFATHGKCKSKNLNNELLQTYKDTIKKWRYRTMPKGKNVSIQLNAPVKATLREIGLRLQEASSDPELKRLVGDALKKLTRRIEQVKANLQEQLNAAVMENYRYFTTEDDIKCPIARELKNAYARINVIRMDERPKHRRGIYKQQRAELINTVTDENDGKPPLVDAISAQVKTRQCELWQAVEEEFIASVLDHFDEFAQALAELLENETYMLEAHRVIREQLAHQLVGFSKDLQTVRDQLAELDSRRAVKRARIVEIKKEVIEWR
ncbi:hypothetical protein E8E12_001591 [Didymella heteroderae]|uniref:Dynamin N-terminal domain-containing protein n=1 Tax=Didymella heteroderae TaxID=1769908 RepID=A0A9P5C2H5_9PLEO|nr:hypothetical protein E8E12_001591 [Didymella heteroderae]